MKGTGRIAGILAMLCASAYSQDKPKACFALGLDVSQDGSRQEVATSAKVRIPYTAYNGTPDSAMFPNERVGFVNDFLNNVKHKKYDICLDMLSTREKVITDFFVRAVRSWFPLDEDYAFRIVGAFKKEGTVNYLVQVAEDRFAAVPVTQRDNQFKVDVRLESGGGYNLALFSSGPQPCISENANALFIHMSPEEVDKAYDIQFSVLSSAEMTRRISSATNEAFDVLDALVTQMENGPLQEDEFDRSVGSLFDSDSRKVLYRMLSSSGSSSDLNYCKMTFRKYKELWNASCNSNSTLLLEAQPYVIAVPTLNGKTISDSDFCVELGSIRVPAKPLWYGSVMYIIINTAQDAFSLSEMSCVSTSEIVSSDEFSLAVRKYCDSSHDK